ncbi:efflux transporter outer membrane subunit [Rouxiella sp. WC2420]|uniref:Efflux transporter outer membrane subunit n=1 Tax=Rouxiella sp. WC2420 TaxID=3234145 RepID=A0AB39VLT7_9GAMM
MMADGSRYVAFTRLGNRLKPVPLLLIGLIVSGCSMFVPDYHRPAVPIASKWSSPLETANKTAMPVSGPWWQDFSSSELNGLMKAGLMENYSLQAAYQRIEESRGTAELDGAPRYPTLALGGLYTRQNNFSTTSKTSVYGQASYETDFWGKNQDKYHSAQQLATAAEYDAETVKMTLAANIANTYFQLLSLDERILLAQKISGDEQHILDLVQTQANLGAGSNLEVEQQRNVLQTYQATVFSLQQQRNQTRFALAVLVGQSPESFTIVSKNLNHVTDPAPQLSFPANLLRRRPDIQAAEARLISTNYDVGAARASFLPDIVVTPLAGINTLAGTSVWSLIGTLTQPIFSGGSLSGQLHFDKAHSQEMAANYKQTLLTAFQDVETQISAVNQFTQADKLNAEAVVSAQEANRLALVQYKLGSIDYQTLLTVERTLYQSEDSSLQVKLQRLQASVGLFRALGGDYVTPSSSPQTNSQVG